jgi:hypothetical protein
MTNNSLSRTFSGVAFLALAAFALPVFPARAADDADFLKQVQSAKTPAEHEAIAKHYDADAAQATASAAMHRKMGEAYKGQAATSSGKGAGISAMPGHCESLAKNYDAEAEHFKSMAQTHRDLAK